MARDQGDCSIARRSFCLALADVLVAPSIAIAQTEKARRIGILYLGKPDDPFVLTNTGAFRQRLRGLGYVDGKTIVIDERFAEGDATRLNELARELVASKVDILVTQAVAATVAARLATSTIPIVMLHAGNPVEAGLIESLARPGGNITGTSNISLGGKLVDLLHEVVPSVRRLAVLGNPTNAGLPPARRDVEEAARRIAVSVVFVAVTRNEDFPDIFAAIRNARPDALLVVVEPLIATHRREVVEFAAAARLPAVYDNGATARIGGLISYAPDLTEHYPLAAIYVDKILKGAKPGDLPVQQPGRYELVINLKTAKALGITIPQSLMARADEVIQ